MKRLVPKQWFPAALALLIGVSLGLAGCGPRGPRGPRDPRGPATTTATTEVGASSGESVAEAAGASAADPQAVAICTACVAAERVGQTVVIEGTIVQQCPASGCWFRLRDGAGEAFVDLNPAQLRLQENRVGQRANVAGRVAKQGGQYRLEAQSVEFLPATNDALSDER